MDIKFIKQQVARYPKHIKTGAREMMRNDKDPAYSLVKKNQELYSKKEYYVMWNYYMFKKQDVKYIEKFISTMNKLLKEDYEFKKAIYDNVRLSGLEDYNSAQLELPFSNTPIY